MFKFHRNRNEAGETMIGENELEKYMDSEFQCLSHLPANLGAISDRYCQCQCGRKRPTYPCEFANFWYTNVNCGRRESNSEDMLKVDRNTVFLTKKNLMMNQFLEYANSTPPTPPPSKSGRTEMLAPCLGGSSLSICSVADACKSSAATFSVRAQNCTSIPPVVCASSSPFLDKRLVSLLRGITLYWFICLNTVLAKSELVKKKSAIALVSEVNCDSAFSSASAKNSTVEPFCRALAELQVSLNSLEKACDHEDDVLWRLFRDSLVEHSRLQKHTVVVLSFDQRSRSNSFEKFVNRLIDSCIAMFNSSNSVSTPRYQLNPFVCEFIPNGMNVSQNENVFSTLHRNYAHPPSYDDYSARVPDFGGFQFGEYPELRAEALPFIPRSHHQQPEAAVEADLSYQSHEVPMETDQAGVPAFATSHADYIGITGTVALIPVNSTPFLEPNSAISSAIAPQPYTDEASMPIESATDFHLPLHQNHIGELSSTDYWKVIAEKYGDPETNAAFANDAANANVENVEHGPLIPPELIKIEPEEPSDGQSLAEDEPMDDENHHAYVDDWQNASTSAHHSTFEHFPFLRENIALSRRRLDAEAQHDSGSYSPPSPVADEETRRSYFFNSNHPEDAQYADARRSRSPIDVKPSDYSPHTFYEPHQPNITDEGDVQQPEGSVSFIPAPESPSATAPETDDEYIDVINLSPSYAPTQGVDWSCQGNQTAFSESPSTRSINSNAVINAGTWRFDGLQTLSNGSNEVNQAAGWQGTSTSELPVESSDQGRQSAPAESHRSTSNNDGAPKEGDAPSSESDDSELIALAHPPAAPQKIKVENRDFLPQGNLDGGQQECSEFNLWGWPWQNSVQLLRQESNQPQSMEESGEQYPEYRLWNMPQVSVVNSHPQTLEPAASAISLQLPTSSHRLDATRNVSSEYNLWSSPKLVDVEQLSSVERQSTETNDTATNPIVNQENSCTASAIFPQFVPTGQMIFSDRGAFHRYHRQSLPDGGTAEHLQMRVQPSVSQLHQTPPAPVADCADDESEADIEVCNLTDEDEQSTSASPNSPYLFQPLAPAFKVVKDVQPPMLRSASGLEYQLNGRKLFPFKHEVDVTTESLYSFQPKYAVSDDDKASQTEPEWLRASVVPKVSRSPFPVHGEPSTSSCTPRSHHSPNLATAQGWPPQNHPQLAQAAPPQHLWPSYGATAPTVASPSQHQPQLAQAALPQHLWPAYGATAPTVASPSQPSQLHPQLAQAAPPHHLWPSFEATAPTVASPSQPWPATHYQPQPTPPFWTASQLPDAHTSDAAPLQYYSLNDVFSHLGQPGFANVGEYDLQPANTFSTT